MLKRYSKVSINMIYPDVMKSLLRLIIVLLLSLFLSALFTPAVFAGISSLSNGSPWPFSRVFDRVFMVTLFLLLIVFRRKFDFGNLKTFLREIPKQKALIAYAALVSFSFSLVAIIFYQPSSELLWSVKPLGYYAVKLLKVIPAALLIGVIEEVFFRGVVLWALFEVLGKFGAIVVSSVLYSVAHFFVPNKSFVVDGFDIFSGFDYLGVLIAQAFSFSLWDAWLGLLLIGVVLAALMVRHRSLSLCIGLHAGWVLASKMIGGSTVFQEGFVITGLAKRYYLVSNFYAYCSVLLIGVAAYFLYSRMAKHEAV